MENPRRPFDRSREPGLKKPRLLDDPGPNPNGRPFAQRPVGSVPAAVRFRGADLESNDPSRGGAYEPQPPPQQQHHELVSQYKTAIAELTFNSKPIITNLTIIAGENLFAAKSITAIVCANILEVPSDQKLPSLYLLDSIVKNIGRDYIKYFAARLPEVFCKAYRQVDPSVHQSMRHLFGTWKGVFPPQALQFIEKELGFASTANGSSSGAATSRSDAQSQRPPHSIHVNPKYLERQRLQQSSRAKGILNDISGAMTDVKEDAERLGRAAIISTGRPWMDPSDKLNKLQHSHGDALSGSLHEKSISAAYGDYEYGSDLSQNSGLGIGRNGSRIADQGQDRPWYGTGSSVQETMSGQRNGVNVKPGLQNSSVSKPVNADPRLRAAHNIANRSNGGLPSSWKNSEEEEFMWDMHSRLSDQDASIISSNSRKESWMPGEAEKLEFGNHLNKTKSIHDFGSRSEREASADSQLTEQKDQNSYGSWMPPSFSLQESHNVNPESYSATISRLTTSAGSSLARMGVQQQFGSSQVDNSGFNVLTRSSPPRQSPMHQRPPSPSFPARHPHQQAQNLVEEDYPQAHSLSLPDSKPSQFSGHLNTRSHNRSAIQASSASLPSFQSSQRVSQSLQSDYLKAEHSGETQKTRLPPVSSFGASSKLGNMSDHLDPHAVETSGLSGTSSLLAAVMNSGILSKNAITISQPNQSVFDLGQMPSQPGSHPSLPSGPPPTLSAASGAGGDSKALSDPASNHVVSVATNISQGKGEQPPLPPGRPPSSAQPAVESKVLNPLSNLLSSLVSKGLISASKTESQSVPPLPMPTQLQDKSLGISTSGSLPVSLVSVSSDTPCSATKDDVVLTEPAAKSSSSLSESSIMDMENLIGLEFRPEVIREFHSSVVNALLDDLPHPCSLCGLQLKLREQLDRHLEWHAMRNPNADEVIGPLRRWYASPGDWIAGKPGQLKFEPAGCVLQSQKTVMEKGEPMVPADENQCACILCGELFEDYFSQERGEWMFNGAVYMTIPTKDGDIGTLDESAAKGPIVHSNCISESSLHDLGLATGVKMEKDV
ncbi:hypothetical protein SLA2020_412620 [Shorea laevis]